MARERSRVIWNHFCWVCFGGGAEKGMRGWGDAGGVVVEGARCRSVLGRIMSDTSWMEDARGRLEGSDSGSSALSVGSLAVSRSREKVSGEALRARWAAAGSR